MPHCYQLLPAPSPLLSWVHSFSIASPRARLWSSLHPRAIPRFDLLLNRYLTLSTVVSLRVPPTMTRFPWTAFVLVPPSREWAIPPHGHRHRPPTRSAPIRLAKDPARSQPQMRSAAKDPAISKFLNLLPGLPLFPRRETSMGRARSPSILDPKRPFPPKAKLAHGLNARLSRVL